MPIPPELNPRSDDALRARARVLLPRILRGERVFLCPKCGTVFDEVDPDFGAFCDVCGEDFGIDEITEWNGAE